MIAWLGNTGGRTLPLFATPCFVVMLGTEKEGFEPSLAVSLGEKPVCAHPRGER